MIDVHKSADRGHFDYGWLDTRHSFAFGQYQDAERRRFRALRVLNEDRVAPGGGFPRHGHRDMEIISYVVDGALEHADSMGNSGRIPAGAFQYIRAGTGIEHSEANASKETSVHFLQIWLLPGARGAEPTYTDHAGGHRGQPGVLLPIAAKDGANGAIQLQQDARLFAWAFEAGQEVRHDLAPGRAGWVQLVTGQLQVNGVDLEPGDGAAIEEESSFALTAQSPGECLIFDLA